jgi:hypothetical protein
MNYPKICSIIVNDGYCPLCEGISDIHKVENEIKHSMLQS